MSLFDLKLGFKCNNNCVHCVVADKRETRCLTLDEMLKIADSLEEGTYLQITGGEPSLFKQELPVLLKRAHDRGVLPAIQTNCTGFADEEFAKACAPYIFNVHIAIHSCNPEIHDKIVGCKGMWDLTMKGFHNLLKYRDTINISTQTVLSKLNIETLYDTFDMIQREAPGVCMSMTYPHLNGNAWNNREEIAFRYTDYQDIFRKTLQRFESNIFTESIPPCYLYPFLDHDSLEKDLLYVKEARVGLDISQSQDLHDYNESDIRDRRKAPRCKDCEFNNECIGVWKEYIELFKNKLDLKPLTEQRMKELDEKYNITRCESC